MLEFELLLNSFRCLSLLVVCSRSFKLAVSNVGLVIAVLLFGFYEFYKARISAVGFRLPGR